MGCTYQIYIYKNEQIRIHIKIAQIYISHQCSQNNIPLTYIPIFQLLYLIWGSAANSHLKSLNLIQKKCIRIISKAEFYAHTEPLFNEYKLLTVPKIYNYNCAKFIYQCYTNNTYTNFKDRLLKNCDIHRYNTRNKNSLRKPFVRLCKFSNSFLYNGIDIWNQLADRVKLATSFDSFKIFAKASIIDGI